MPARLIIALLYDLVDALNMVSVLGDIGEGFGGGLVGFLLTGNLKATLAVAIDGILPPPFDFFPTATTIVIADEMGWLE
ncbi:hypothetical protein [Geoglobus acetivorans]|uniref:hypothetical protein n=1 Tax=Geoglobus acetivorans TaxID=565033 RepID=UPI00296EB5A3